MRMHLLENVFDFRLKHAVIAERIAGGIVKEQKWVTVERFSVQVNEMKWVSA